MKLKVFQYVILLHPSEEKKGKTTILKGPETIMAKDEKQAQTLVSREIPAEQLDNLDNVEISVRPFT